MLNESETARSLVWSYANEVADGTIRCNNAPEESHKICIITEHDEPGGSGPDRIDVSPVYCETNCSVFSYNAKRSA